MKWLACLAIFAAAFLANRRAGTAPLMWNDTFNDAVQVARCLDHGACSLVGVQTSIPGLYHAVAWLQLRTLLQWLGADAHGLLLFVQLLNALAATIAYFVATAVGGPIAGALAAAILVFGIDGLGVPIAGLNNLSSLLFLGAVLTLACTAVVMAPGAVAVVLAALVAAVTANVHLICALFGVSVVCVTLLAPRRRLLLAALGASAFAAAALAIAAPSWRHNLLAVLQRAPIPPSAEAVRWPPYPIVAWALFGVGAWVLAQLARARDRHAATGAVAVIAPPLAALLLAPHLGVRIDPKYLTPIRAACAVAAALPIGRIAHATLEVILPRTAFPLVARALPFAAALVIAWRASLGLAHPERVLTVDDLAGVAQVLRQQGWDDRQIARGFSTPARMTALTGLLQQQISAAPSAAAVAYDSALVLLLATDQLAAPLPPDWRVLRESAGTTVLLVLERSPLDWTRAAVCPVDGSACEPLTWDGFDPRGEGVNALPHMPRGGAWGGPLRLRVPILAAAPNRRGALFRPRGELCAGRIVAVDGVAADISADRRRVTFSPAGDAPAHVDVEWVVDSPDCPAVSYDGLPPFVVAGDAATVDRLERVLRRAEEAAAGGGAA
ncbi:MAG: hypothetical protein U0802_24225 [Candidatus Binatia bacterium]